MCSCWYFPLIIFVCRLCKMCNKQAIIYAQLPIIGQIRWLGKLGGWANPLKQKQIEVRHRWWTVIKYQSVKFVHLGSKVVRLEYSHSVNTHILKWIMTYSVNLLQKLELDIWNSVPPNVKLTASLKGNSYQSLHIVIFIWV